MTILLSSTPDGTEEPIVHRLWYLWAGRIWGVAVAGAALVLLLLGAQGWSRSGVDLRFDPAITARVTDVSTDWMGDVSVVFTLREERDTMTSQATAMSDALAIVRAVYASPEGYQGATVTVMGTLPDPDLARLCPS